MSLSDQIARVEAAIQTHVDSIARLQEELETLRQTQAADLSKTSSTAGGAPPHASHKYPLLAQEYTRYGRQLIMPEVGLSGQLRLKSTSVLIVGVGGLGCPAAAYLAGAGIGTLGLVDGDTVEESNLHRQILHGDHVGMNKAKSAALSLAKLNPLPVYKTYTEHLSPSTATSIIKSYDIILDCTDNPASRYLISDCAVLLGKALISASALRTEGQLMLLNHPARPAGDISGGPCYRCIFPVPPPATSVATCGEGGILGPVVGTMGVLQALEAIKMICNDELSTSLNGLGEKKSIKAPTLLLFSAYQDPQFRTIKMRRRSPKCAVCSANATVSLKSIEAGSMDYVQFCGATSAVTILSPEERVNATQFAAIANDGRDHVVLDVREKTQYELCALPYSLNVPFSETVCSGYETEEQVRAFQQKMATVLGDAPTNAPVYVVCRLGNDSQLVVRRLQQLGFGENGQRQIIDVEGGLRAWTRDVDGSFPDY